ncbi:InlB B-repeat-containing protein [Anaerofustis stercorihominis]|uniref:InlB B-repeat-containing protein n=1 Tax=Anaerofustis stercorihominis TaxID=214853 RepID=UPI0015F34BEB|nr:hypothetical protein [Anaerofustis stercorihominis]
MFLFVVMALFILISVPSISKAADDKHAIKIEQQVNVTADVDKSSGVKGEEVILTMTPNPGYKIKDSDTQLIIKDIKQNLVPFTKISGPDSNLQEKFKFTIGDYDIKIQLPYPSRCSDLTVDPNIKFGKVTLKESKLCLWETGHIEVINDPNYHLSEIYIEYTNGNKEFPVFNGMTGTYDYTENNAYPGIVHAKFEKDTYEIYISPDIKGGTITANKKSAGVNDIVTLTVKEDKGYKLKNININGDVVDPIKLTKISDLKYQFKMPRSGIFISADFKKVSDNTPIVKKGGNTKSSGTKITAAKKNYGFEDCKDRRRKRGYIKFLCNFIFTFHNRYCLYI